MRESYRARCASGAEGRPRPGAAPLPHHSRAIAPAPSRALAGLVAALLVALAVTLALPPRAQALLSTGDGGWKWQAPQPQGNNINGVAYQNATTCWAVGESGTLLVSSDGGATWTTRRSGTTKVLNGIAFGDALNGWAVGEQGTIIATTNGGATWKAQASGTTYELNAVAAAGGNLAWAVGTQGKIFATTDAGATWTPQTSTVTSDLYGVEFLDASNGWVGTAQKVLTTVDGGATWVPRDAAPSGTLLDVSFADATHIWAAGGGLVRASSDAGVTWAPATVPFSGDLCGIDFVTSQIGWTAGYKTLLQTTNGGGLWGNELPPIEPNEAPFFRTLTAGDESHALAAGIGGLLWSTTDGDAWVKRTSLDEGGGVEEVTAFSAQRAVVAMNDGTIRATADGGTTWTTQREGDWSTSLEALEFTDSLHGCAAGYDLAVYTTDGGATWLPATMPAAGARIYDIHYATASHVWAVGESGAAWESNDGGATWTARDDVGSGMAFYGVAFGDALHGWIFGYDTILHTSDGGATWTPQEPPFTDYIYDGHFFNANSGWVGAGSGRLMRTTDGGETWTVRSVPGGNIKRVVFASSTRGWAVGDGGLVAATPDGGKHWVEQRPGLSRGLTDVAFADRVRGWLVGDYPSIHVTSTNGYNDPSQPMTRAYAASVKRGRTATLAYRVTDPLPTCGWANATIRIKTTSGRTVKTLSPGVRAVNSRLTTSFKCYLSRGTYRVYVYATDAAGRTQKRITSATLTVT